MATLRRSVRLLLCCLLVVCSAGAVIAASIGTQWEGLTHTIAGKLESYANAHDGKMPSTLDELYTGIDAALLEEQLGGPPSSKVIYFGDQKPQLKQNNEELLAVVAFPISEDRRAEVGRYIIYRNQGSKIGSRWESEKVIQVAATRANAVLPFASTYQEKPIKPLYPEYGMRLVEDAVKHGVPIEQAVKAVERHVDDVNSRRAKAASTWAEIAAAVTGAATPAIETPARATPAPVATPVASPSPASPAANPPAATVERGPAAWLWLVGIAALTVIALLVWKRRA